MGKVEVRFEQHFKPVGGSDFIGTVHPQGNLGALLEAQHHQLKRRTEFTRAAHGLHPNGSVIFDRLFDDFSRGPAMDASLVLNNRYSLNHKTGAFCLCRRATLGYTSPPSDLGKISDQQGKENMKIPLNWLKDYVDFEDSIESFCDKLTFAGLEVENIETIGGTFEGIMVGEVTAIDPHPDADKLRLCTVEYGAAEPLRVVCGAPNAEVGGKYPFAPVGTTLPCGIKLKKAKIRGVESLGMLCASDELGLSSEHAGLLKLDRALTPGTPLANVMGSPETVIEIEVTPNRPDCLSIIGVAREVAALYGTELKLPSTDLAETSEKIENLVRVEIKDTEKCPRYTARVLTDAKIGPSPEWIARRLEACGIRPINNIVDITNYVLLETGHPLHAFDYTLLKDGKIIVRRAKKDEKFTTLDGEERELTNNMLVIADPEKAVALGGIMGGANTEIRENTSTILLESAGFEPSGIRHTAKTLGLSTDSSYRFQRGVNTDTVEWASRRAAALLAKYTGATCCAGVVNVHPTPKTVNSITVHWANVCKVIGLDIPADEIKTIFDNLEIKILQSDSEKAVVEPPSFRDDLTREIDLIEEIARLHGLDKIPANMPIAQTIPGSHDDRVRAISGLRRALTGLGARETLNYTLVAHPLLDLFGTADRNAREELPHPISTDQSVLRTSLIPQMVESLGRNKSRQIDEALFFEIGRTFTRTKNGPVQRETVCFGLMGPVGRGALDKQRAITEEEVFLWLKGLIEKLLAEQNVSGAVFTAKDTSAFEPGRAIEISVDGTAIGLLGLVNAKARREWRLNDPVAVAELDLTALIDGTGHIEPGSDLPLYPSVERDFAFIVDEAVEHTAVLAAIQQSAPVELEKVELFDLFRSKEMEKGRKSLAYRFIYRSAKGTLTDEQVNAFHEPIGTAVCAATGALIRER